MQGTKAGSDRIRLRFTLLAEPSAAGSVYNYKWGGVYSVFHPRHSSSSEAFCKASSVLYSSSLSLCLGFRQSTAIMSSCDCDRKDSNGGNCDSSCKEESFEIVEISSPVSFAPVLAVRKAAGVEVIVSFEGRAEHA